MAQLNSTKIYVAGTYPMTNTTLLILHPNALMVLFAVTVLTGPLVFMTIKGRYNTRMDK